MYIYVYTCVCIYDNMHVCMYMCIYISIYLHISLYVYTYIHINIYDISYAQVFMLPAAQNEALKPADYAWQVTCDAPA